MTKRKTPKDEAVHINDATFIPARKVLTGKLGALQTLIGRPEGASLAEMMEATGWQAHSVRGAISGALRKTRGIEVVSDLQDGERRYRIAGGV